MIIVDFISRICFCCPDGLLDSGGNLENGASSVASVEGTLSRQQGAWRQNMTAEALEKYNKEQQRRKKIRAVIIHISLVLTLVIYTFIGAAIFQKLEQKEWTEDKVHLLDAREDLLDELWLSNTEQVDRTNWTLMAEKLLLKYVEELSKATSHGIDISNAAQLSKNHNVTSDDWDFWTSVFFAGTVYTSIGYGHLYPVTKGGRIATMIYATIGIPLCFIVLADVGGLLSEALKFSLRSIKKLIYKCQTNKDLEHRWPRHDEIENLSGVSVFICLVVILLIYFVAGAAMYRIWETQWDYMDAFYFIFISTSTIGFGDVLPDHPRYFLLSAAYIIFGLALISTGFTVLQEIMQSSINKATDQIDNIVGLNKEDEDDRSASDSEGKTQLSDMQSESGKDNSKAY